MAAGTYTGTITASATGLQSAPITVTLTVTSGEDQQGLQAIPFTSDPNLTGTVSAEWVRGPGVPVVNTDDQNKYGLVLTKYSPTSTAASAGANITGVSGISITEIGFDVAEGGHCTATAPRFVITTTDSVVHNVVGCAMGTSVLPAPALGWKRVRFDVTNLAQAVPPINPTSTVQSMSVVLDKGPDATTKSGNDILDNIDVNGSLIGRGANSIGD
jgi:hypothetical protein